MNMSTKDMEYKRQHGLCFYCNQKGYLKKNCPTRPPTRDRSSSREPSNETELKKESTDLNSRVVTVRPMPKVTAQKVYLDIEVNGYKTLGLVDNGAEKSLIPYSMVKDLKLEKVDVQLYAGNGTNIH